MASPEERKRFSSAGQLPVSGMEAQRLLEGRGISPSASKEEKKAWVASEVMLGMRGPEDLPEEYGGRPQLTARPRFDKRGEPTGSFRRQLRMQESWDAERNRQIEEQKAFQSILDSQKNLQLREMEYNRGIENDRLNREDKLQKEADDAEVRRHGLAIYDGIKTIDFKNDPDAILKLDSLANEYPRGLEMQGLSETLTRKQNIASTYGAAKSNKEKQALSELVNTSYNDYLAAGGGPQGVALAIKADPVTGDKFIDPFELQKQTALIKGAGVKAEKEKQAKQPQVEAEKAAASSARSLINDFEKESARSAADIARLTKLVQGGDKKSQALLDAKMAEKSVYDSKIEELKAGLGGGAAPSTTPTIPTIKSLEEFNNLPSGTEYIAPDGKKYRKN